MPTNQELVDTLETKYCPPLDTALFLTIVSDYDFTREADRQAAQQTLDALTEVIQFEEATGFDSSGSGGNALLSPGNSNHGSARSWHSAQEWSSATDENSFLDHGVSAIDLDDSATSERDLNHGKGDRPRQQLHDTQFDTLTMEAKEAMLVETFPDAKPFDIKWTLKKCNGDASIAIDELLNQSFLEHNGGRHRGVEAFSESDLPAKPRKGKKKRSRYTSLSNTASTTSSDTESSAVEMASKWENAQKDIDFISGRANMPKEQVSELYKNSGSSMQPTVNAIVNGHMGLGLDTQNSYQRKQAQTLAQTYPAVSMTRLIALIQITHPDLKAAEDLAQVLITRPLPKAPVTISGRGAPIQISFQMPPPDLGDTNPDLSSSHSTKINSLYRDEVTPYLAQTSSELSALRQNAFQNATSAHRAAKSNPLMGGAAAYYSQVGRDLSSRLHTSTASEMDQLVSSQSTPTSCDLHGVDVKNGVRIACERVRGWWGSGRNTHTGYQIVTGKGTHSQGGVSRLRPAVLKMLIAEGWKVEVLSGVLLVTGVVGSGVKKR